MPISAIWDDLWLDARLATMTSDQPYGLIDAGAIGVLDGRIAFVGSQTDLPDTPEKLARTVHRCAGALATPGLVDCHTHIVHGGDRAREFELRLNGASYEEIARAGGGIMSTVRMTRAASEDQLVAEALPRVRALMAEGVSTIEIKSGYGLELATERRTLAAARRLGRELGIDVRTTFLGAHALPPEYAGRADDYIDLVCDVMIPALAADGLVDAVDVFCERIAFSVGQTDRVFTAARSLGLPVKLHAEQLSNQRGAVLAARHGALSCDHLEYVEEDGVAAMAEAGTVAVLLPGAFYFLRETKVPPVDLLRRHRVPIAISTDSNPGSSPVTSLLLMLNMACTLFRITPEEALAGVTRNAARALGLAADRGTLEVGKRADFCLWQVAHPAELCYRFGHNPLIAALRCGAFGDPKG